MEQEAFFSGYCRVLDGSRTVCAVKENSVLTVTDCDFPGCAYAAGCPVGKSISEFLSKE